MHSTTFEAMSTGMLIAQVIMKEEKNTQLKQTLVSFYDIANVF